MASAFQRRKVTGVFEAMDVDGDGFLEEEDFQALSDRWNRVRGYEPGSEGSSRIEAVMMGWWQALLQGSDLNRDNKVTLDEVLLTVDQLPNMVDAVAGTAHTMFDAIDENEDGTISEVEYRQVITGWKGYEADTADVFARLDLNSDGVLSRDEFVGHWVEFWAGDDDQSPSQYVFGPI